MSEETSLPLLSCIALIIGIVGLFMLLIDQWHILFPENRTLVRRRRTVSEIKRHLNYRKC